MKNTSQGCIVRGESGPADLMTIMIIDPIVFTIERRMLLGLKARAEGRPDTHPALMMVALFGWIAAGITLIGILIILLTTIAQTV